MFLEDGNVALVGRRVRRGGGGHRGRQVGYGGDQRPAHHRKASTDSLGESADYYFVSGMREGATTAGEGLLSALIRRTDPGVKVEGTWNAMGMRGTVSHTIRYETFVEESQVIGPPAGLFSIDLSGFALGYSATYLGIGEAAFDYILEFVKTKTIRPSTEPLSHHPVTQRTIGELATALAFTALATNDAVRVSLLADDTTTADDAYGLASQGIGLLWRGDFQNARQMLTALAHRARRDLRQKADGPRWCHRSRPRVPLW